MKGEKSIKNLINIFKIKNRCFSLIKEIYQYIIMLIVNNLLKRSKYKISLMNYFGVISL